MLTGKIFRSVTGKSVEDCQTPLDVWGEVKDARPVREFGVKQYGNTVVTPHGDVFRHRFHDSDIDKILETL